MAGIDTGADQGLDRGADQGGQFPPLPPPSLTASPGDTTAALSWSGQPDAASYNAYRSAHGAGTFALVGNTGGTSTSLTDLGLTDGNGYDYYVTAVGANFMESQPSNIVSVTPSLAVPNAPTSPSATSAFATVGGTPNTPVVNLAWSPPSSGNAPTGYSVYRGTAAGAESATALATLGTVLSYQDQTALPGTQYFYTIKALDAAGNSAASSEVSAKTACLPPTITVTPGDTIANVNWGAVTGASGYNVKRRSPSGSGTFATIAANVSGTSYPDTGLTDAVSYDYEVTALD